MSVWSELAAEVLRAAAAGSRGDKGDALDVVDAELLLPPRVDEPVVVLRVRASRGRVLEFDMPLHPDGIGDATDDYDEVDQQLVRHEYDMKRPEEVERYFGRAPRC